ncbi:MAG TPA: OmpH family outer membrane protein [Luteibaculaceae bacterium]|nr:OmpH family outer membrane protein [Luteibaculaceae bacterium]
MNKALVAVNAVLIAAVAYLFFQVHFNSAKETPVVTASQKANQMPVTSKIAYFNTDSLTEKYAYIKEKNELLKEEERRLTSGVEAKARALQTRYAELQQKSATMTEREAEAATIELREMEQNLETMRAKAAEELERKNIEILKELYKKLEDFLNRYNKEQKFDYILKFQEGGFIAWGKPALDITDDVIKGMNEEYQASKK